MTKLYKKHIKTHSTNGFMGQKHTPTTTYTKRAMIDPKDKWLFQYPFIHSDGEGFRERYGDEYLKEIGIFGEVLMADAVWRYFETVYPDPDDAREWAGDYFYYKMAFEEEGASERKKMLNPSFLEKIERYLYNFEERPDYMDCWNAPIEVLEQYGITKDVLNIK